MLLPKKCLVKHHANCIVTKSNGRTAGPHGKELGPVQQQRVGQCTFYGHSASGPTRLTGVANL